MSATNHSYYTATVENQAAWNAFVTGRPEANFLQSWQWGVFQEKIGKKVFRVGLFEGEDLVAGAQVVKEEAKRGWYLTVAGGPLVGKQGEVLASAMRLHEDPDHQFILDVPDTKKRLSSLTEALETLAKQEKCIFIRVRPQLLDTPTVRSMYTQLKYQEAPMHLTADLTLQLDLRLSEDELLAGMRKNTRYEVRKAQKLGIEVQLSTNHEDIKEFYRHQVELAQKHGFVPFEYEFLLHQFETFVQEDQVVLFHSYQGETLLASAFVIFFNREAVYHYGISTHDNNKLPGSYACQWAAIQEAQRRGCDRYNFWGIAPKEENNHRFAGVSLFKRGFGGVEVPYLPAHDLSIDWKYGVTRSFETVRRKLRKL